MPPNRATWLVHSVCPTTSAWRTGEERRPTEDIAPETANGIVRLTYVAILKDYGHDVSILPSRRL